MGEIERKLIRGLLAAETKIVIDRLSKAAPGETVSYIELNKLTGCDVRKRRFILYTAFNRLLCEQLKVFVSERGIGIRLLYDTEIALLGQRDVIRIGNIARRCRRKLEAAKYEDLSPDERIQHNASMTLLVLFQRGSTTKSQHLVERAVRERAATLSLNETLKLFGQA